MKKNITRALIAGLFTLASASAFASGALTAFSSTNNTVGGVGNVTITFTITDANFGAPPNGGWYLALQLPAGMTTGSTYATDANCAVNAVYSLRPQRPQPPHHGVVSARVAACMSPTPTPGRPLQWAREPTPSRFKT